MEWDPTRIRALRRALRLPQETFAYKLGASPKTVRNWERGSHPPSLTLQRALDDALESASPQQKQRFFAALTSGSEPARAPQHGALDQDGATQQLWMEEEPRLSPGQAIQALWSRTEAGTLEMAVLDELAATVGSDARLHDRLGSRAVHGLVVEHVRLATGLLRGNPPPALRPRLAAVASEAAAEAGLVCHDQRHLPAARSYYRLADELAQEAGDPLLQAYVLGNWSRKLTEVGDGAAALSFVDSARTVAGRRQSSATSAYVAIAEAEAQAALGEIDACLRALDRADEARQGKDATEDPPWLLWLHDAHLAGWKGYCQMRLGRFEDAGALLAVALSTWDPSFVRDRALTLLNLALVRLHQDELDACCRLAAEALELAVATSSPRVVHRLRGLRVELQPWSQSSEVKVLDEQMVAASWV